MAVVAGGGGALERADPLTGCFESDSSALETPTQYAVVFFSRSKSQSNSLKQLHAELRNTVATDKELEVWKVEAQSAAGTCVCECVLLSVC